MNPIFFIELYSKKSPNYTHEEYYNKQYPATQDCIAMDKQIAAIQADIDEINKRSLSNKIETGKKELTEVVYGKEARKRSLNFLIDLLNKKKNFSALMDCRNKIETKRQDESASLFTETAEASEKRILTQTKSKTYLLIGVGAVTVLTALYLLTKKKS